MRSITATLLTGIFAVSPALASETALNPGIDPSATGAIQTVAMEGLSDGMNGNWKGRGKVLANLKQERPFNVKCDFDVDGDETSVAIVGECGALFVKRPVSVKLEEKDGGVVGTYEADLRTGVAELEGDRDGGSIALDVEWGGEVNGDSVATMQVERVGQDELRIVFRDIHPDTGEEVVTTEFNLERS